jgi:hypothetical protein
MSADRNRVRELVREELARKLAAGEEPRHPALLLVQAREEETVLLEPEAPRPCVIEPDRPCYQSGYCKRLGY